MRFVYRMQLSLFMFVKVINLSECSLRVYRANYGPVFFAPYKMFNSRIFVPLYRRVRYVPAAKACLKCSLRKI